MRERKCRGEESERERKEQNPEGENFERENSEEGKSKILVRKETRKTRNRRKKKL